MVQNADDPAESVKLTEGRLNAALASSVPISIYQRELNQGILLADSEQLGQSLVDGGTSIHRQRSHATGACADISCIFGNYVNFGGGERSTTAPITVRAVLEYPINTFSPLFFNGEPIVLIKPNQTALSDPLSIVIPANAYYYIRTYATVPALRRISAGLPIGPPACADLLGADASDCGANYLALGGDGSNQLTTPHRGWITNTHTYAYGPIGVVGKRSGGASPHFPVVAIVGDSIADYCNDSYDGGFLSRALIAADLSYYRLARGGERASDWILPERRRNRMLRLLECSTIIFEYGTNDLNEDTSFASFRTTILGCLLAAGSYGASVWVTTIMPCTTSTDEWVTAANQSVSARNPHGYNVVRQQVNAYYRAPRRCGSGKSLAYDLRAQGTLFGGCIDCAQAVETTSSNIMPLPGVHLAKADRWYVSGGTAPTSDGGHPSQAIIIEKLSGIVPTGLFGFSRG